MAVEAARRALRTTGAVPTRLLARRRPPTPTARTPPPSTPRCGCPTAGAFDAGLSPRSAWARCCSAPVDGHGADRERRRPRRAGRVGRRSKRRRRRGGVRRRRRRRHAGRRRGRRHRQPHRRVHRPLAITGDTRSKTWDDKFAEVTYPSSASTPGRRARRRRGHRRRDRLGRRRRPDRRIAARSPPSSDRASSTTSPRTSATPAPHSPGCCSPRCWNRREPGQLVALVSLADGADVFCSARPQHCRRADRHRRRRPAAAGGPSRTGATSLARHPRRRAAPPTRAARVSATAAARGTTGSSVRRQPRRRVRRGEPAAGRRLDPPTDRAGRDGRRAGHDRDVHRRPGRLLPRARPSCSRSSTSTAVGGSRSSSPTRDRARCAIGMRVELTFRRLGAADGIVNYFWKGRLIRG